MQTGVLRNVGKIAFPRQLQHELWLESNPQPSDHESYALTTVPYFPNVIVVDFQLIFSIVF